MDIAREVVLRHDGGFTLDEDKARRLFDDVWTNELGGTFRVELRALDRDYVWEEIRRVIAGRSLRGQAEYLEIRRYGRKKPLNLHQRRAVWHVAGRYELRCQLEEPRVYDADSLIGRAYTDPELARYLSPTTPSSSTRRRT